jgi:Flp pilus assembly protein TadG
VPLLSRRRNERGAVAVLAAAMSVMLCLFAGFAVDFGMAYNSKRQLQTSADAAALAAASVYARYPGTCATLAANSSYRAAAQSAADAVSADNRPGRTTSSISVACANGGKTLQVTYADSGSTPTAFGRLAGIGNQINASGQASATVGVSPEAADAVRPMAVCSAALPSWATADSTTKFARVDSPADGHKKIAACPDAGAAGNWWTTDCPEERTGATGVLTDEIQNGCQSGVRIAGDGSSPAALTISLETACPSAPIDSQTCLSGDPGQMDSGHIEASWQTLINAQTKIVLPVFCVAPQCTESTLDGSGTNAVFPVYKLAAVVVCGYHFGKNVTYTKSFSSTDPCYGNTLPSVLTDSSSDNYMQVALVNIQTSGGTDNTTCALGADCDGGLRRVLLSD